MKTQSQHYLQTAARRVGAVQGKSWQKIYGGLCHSFPVLVKTAGLAQALAFHESKAGDSGDREHAHRRLMDDFRDLLPPDQFDIGGASVSDYMRATRQVLAAWVFYKRFAVSILKAEDAQSGKEGANDAPNP